MKGFATGLFNFLLYLSIAALGLVLMLNYTILKPDFVIAELDKVNAYSLVKEQLEGQFVRQIPQELEFATEAIDTTLTNLEPWIKEQVRNSVYAIYDYLLGKSQNLSVVISTDPVKESLRDNLWAAIQKSPPPELAGLPPALLEPFFNQFYEQEISKQIPPTFEFNVSTLPPETMVAIEQVRQAVSYIEITFIASIAVTILSILGIVLINRRVKTSTRGIGITFTTYGAIWYGGIFAVKYFVPPQIAKLGIPLQFQPWISQILDDIVAPLQMFSLGCLIAGVVLIIVSRVYKSRQPSY